MKRSIAVSLMLALAPVAFAQSSGKSDAQQKPEQEAAQPARGEHDASGGSSASSSLGGSSAGAESQSAKKPKTGDYYQSNENKADPNLKEEKRKEKEEGITN